jgi:hypothetical protein
MSIQANLEWENNQITEGVKLAKDILRKLIQNYKGTFVVRFWNGTMLQISDGLPA